MGLGSWRVSHKSPCGQLSCLRADCHLIYDWSHFHSLTVHSLNSRWIPWFGWSRSNYLYQHQLSGTIFRKSANENFQLVNITWNVWWQNRTLTPLAFQMLTNFSNTIVPSPHSTYATDSICSAKSISFSLLPKWMQIDSICAECEFIRCEIELKMNLREPSFEMFDPFILRQLSHVFDIEQFKEIQ